MNSPASLLNLSGSDDTSRAFRSVECAAFIADDETRRVVAQVCGGLGKQVTVAEGGSREAMEYLSEAPMPEVLIVDVSDTGKPLSTMLTITAAFAENTKVIAIGSVNDIALYRELIDGGVSDYLVKPVSEKALSEAIVREHAPAQPAEPAADKPAANLIAMIGTRGGVGASTIAANCAWIAAQEHKHQTTLLDLDLQFGTVALALDIEPTRGLREALENPSRIDSLFLSSAAAKLSDRLTVLAAEEAVDGEVHFDPSAVDLLLAEINRSCQYIFVDLPRTASVGRSRLLQLATQVVVVTEVTLAGLRDCIRLVAMLERAAPQAKLLVVANRAGRSDGGLNKAEFEKALGRKVDVILPEDAKALATSVNRGKPLATVAKSSKFVAALRQLTRRLEGGEQSKTAKKKTALPFLNLLKKKK